MPARTHALVFMSLVQGASLAAQAPPADDASELMALLNTPIESASKRSQKAIESPQAVEVITAEQIKASGVFRFIDVLRMATSVQVWDKDPERANVTLRGVNPADNPRTLQVLVDGVPLFNLVASPIDFNGIPVPLDAIERVEIVRGPSSSLYGANAQMGVIAITTRRARNGFAGSVRAGAGSNGMARGEGYAALGGDRFSITAAVAGASERDLNTPISYIGRPGVEVPENTATREQQAYIRPEMDLGAAGKVWAAFGHGESGHADQVSRNQANLAALAVFPNLTSGRDILQAGWSKAWSPALRTELRFDQKTLHLKLDPLQADPSNPGSATIVHLLETVDPSLATRHDFYYDRIRETALQVNWEPAGNVHVVAGGDAKSISTGACKTIGLAGDMSFTAAGAFLSVDVSFDALTLSAGARAANESLGGSSTSPRFSAVYDLGPGGVLRAGYFTSTRSPMVQEKLASIPNIPVLAYLQIPNPGIQSEKVDDLELGYRKNWERWSLDFTVFRNQLKGLIVNVDSGLPRVAGKAVNWFANSPTDFDDSGVEMSVTGEPVRGWLLGFNVATASFKDPIYGQDRQADYSPKGTANLWVRTHRGIFFAYAAVQYVAAYTVAYSGPAGLLRQDVPGNAQVHFNVGLEPVKGLSLSAYAVNAAKPTTDSSSQTLLNQFGLRYSRRELGLQASYQF